MKKTCSMLLLFAILNSSLAQVTKVNSFLDSFTKKNNFNGTILIDEQGKITFKRSFGLANFPFKIPNTPDTRYKIASITKAFTAVMILQLHEQGRVDLNKTIKSYLPDYNGAGGNQITVKQLLSMTAGMHNMDDGTTMESVLKQGMPQYQRPYTSDELVLKFCSDTLVNKPGEVFDYNNADFIILGKIIEKVTGKSYEQVLTQNILQPLKMSNSGFLHQHTIIPKLADTYFYRDDLKQMVNDLPVYINNWYAAGAMYSTVDDILKFSSALFNRKLLNQQTLNQMFTSGPGEYGYGVWVYKDYEINKKMYTIVKRPGSIMGAQAMLFHVLENRSTIIILSNTGTVDMDRLAADLADRLVK